MKHKPSSQSGFSIIEVALVMIIGGILLSLFSGTLITMISGSKMKTTQERMRTINEAIQIYAAANNRLPCVASRTIAANAPAANGYGRETSCSAAEAPGTEDTGDVRIGFVPTRVLNIPDETGYDGWGSRIMYAVTESLTTTAGYDLSQGRIQVNDTSGTITTTATYVVYSVGPDRRGGYGTSGTPFLAAPVNPAADCNVPAGRVDIENCDDDNTFVTTMMTGSTNDANHYDDYLTYFGNFQTSLIPAGALVAFDRTECPSGWTEHAALRGRMVVGAGTFTEAGDPPDDTGSTTGTITFAQGSQGGWASRISSQGTDAIRVNNMPPYVAYIYCRKN
jgi:prepilin-type N-terminal cleavage/methylation domain-containing protein